MIDWHEVALGSIALIGVVGGWCWMRTVQQLDAIEVRLTAHIEWDGEQHGKIYDHVRSEVRALDDRVDRRFQSRDHR